MPFIFFFFILSLIGLIYFSDWVVEGVVKLAAIFDIPKFILSIFILGFGTSLPELVTAIQAALVGAPDLILSNIIGSNFANIGLILGCSALIIPLNINKKSLKGDAFFLFSATLLLTLFALSFTFISTLTGILFLLFFIGYIYYHYRLLKQHREENKNLKIQIEDKNHKKIFAIAFFQLIIGFIGMSLSAHYLIENALEIAIFFNVPQFIIGFTMIAIGTSLPELATSLVALYRGENAMIFGNIMGSNIYNILAIIGISSLITPLNGAPALPSLYALLTFTSFYLLLAFLKGKISRIAGIFFLLIYFVSFWQFVLRPLKI